jgi:hypothetical protein
MKNFYEVNQNNTGGSFDVDETVCHRLFIEADSMDEAIDIAESLGCYWDGVENGMDCPCCGDRWYGISKIDLDNINTKWGGYTYDKFLRDGETVEGTLARYPNVTWTKELKLRQKYGSDYIEGKIYLDSIETYAQILADLYGWTTPDVRIFYKDGEVKEIFSNKAK